MKEKILIVDNDPEMLWQLDYVVREFTKYEPVVTNNPLEALEMMKKEDFGAIVTELKMPVLDGTAFVEAVKTLERATPVIIITAYGTVETAVEAMKKGCADFILKPFRRDQLLYAIERALNLCRLQKENDYLRNELSTISGKSVGEAVVGN